MLTARYFALVGAWLLHFAETDAEAMHAAAAVLPEYATTNVT